MVSDWRKTPRYGFLADFYSDDMDDAKDIEALRKLHINMVQFYDWMYRGDMLVSSSEEYTDMMGRKVNSKVVMQKVSYCHDFGMHALAYGAVYSACREFYEKHRDWGLYDANSEVLKFIDRFYIMNISQECPWHDHIIEQYKQAVEIMGFDGIHMDTYGFPKKAVSIHGNERKIEYLDEHFPILIENTRKTLSATKEDVCLIFNNVGNWPVVSVADTCVDAIYIEVWKPYERYCHLQQIIMNAQTLGKGKAVILAAYLKPFENESNEEIQKAETAALLLTAVVYSHGAYSLLWGEEKGVLTQGYYVDYAEISGSFFRIIRNYHDFIIRYSNLFFDSSLKNVSMTHADGDNKEYIFENLDYSTYGEAGKVWVVIRENKKYKVISLINFSGCTDDYWNKGKNPPCMVDSFKIKVQAVENIKSFFTASPDQEFGRPEKPVCYIENNENGKYFVFDKIRLNTWSILVICME